MGGRAIHTLSECRRGRHFIKSLEAIRVGLEARVGGLRARPLPASSFLGLSPVFWPLRSFVHSLEVV